MLKLLKNLEHSKDRIRFILTHADGNRFTINSYNLKNVTIKRKHLIFFESDVLVITYILTHPELKYYLSDTTLETDSFLDEALIKVLTKIWVMT